MLIPISLISSAVLFIAGVVFLFKGYKQVDSNIKESDVVPIMNIHEIYKSQPQDSLPQKIVIEKENTAPAIVQKSVAEEKMDLPTRVVSKNENIKEEKNAGLEEEIRTLKENLAQKENESQQKVTDLIKERNQFKEALERELSSKNKAVVSGEGKQFSEERELRLQQAEGSLVRLTGENYRLQKICQEQSEKYAHIEAELNFLRNKPHDQNTALKTEALEQELARWKEQSRDQAQKDKIAVEKIRQENSELIKKTEQAQEQIRSLLKEIQALKAQLTEVPLELDLTNVSQSINEDSIKEDPIKEDNKELIKRIEEYQQKLDKAQEQLEYVKLSYEEKITDLSNEIYALKNQYKGADPSSGVLKIDPLAISEITIEELKNENNKLKQRTAEFESDYQKTKQYNDHLIMKEKLLQYELTKFRAQALGLEKICEDFKSQIEEKEAVIE